MLLESHFGTILFNKFETAGKCTKWITTLPVIQKTSYVLFLEITKKGKSLQFPNLLKLIVH